MKNVIPVRPLLMFVSFLFLTNYTAQAQCNASASFLVDQGFGGSPNNVLFVSTSTSSSGFADYTWIFPDGVNAGTYSGCCTNFIQNTYTGPGLYGNHTATLIVVDSAGCSDTITQTFFLDSCNLIFSPVYTVLNSDSTNPDTLSYTITATSVHAPVSYSASFGTQSSNTASGSFVYNPGSGNIPLSMTASDGISCKDSVSYSINTGAIVCNMNALFTFSVTGSAVHLYNMSTTSAQPFTSYWTVTGDTTYVSIATNPVIPFPLNLNNYNICLITTDANGCSDTTCQSVTRSDTLCGVVFSDVNSNGNYDFGEQVFPNANVKIDNLNYYTDASGFYHVGVGPGTHIITLNGPLGWTQTLPFNPNYHTVTTTQNNYICGLDFGLRDDTLLLSGIVYNDLNLNGIYDAGDSPRSGVTVQINGSNTYTAQTNSSGYYSKLVYSGTYTVSYNPPSGYVLMQPINPTTYTVTVVSTGLTGLNFGVANNNVTIRGKIYIDANNNGVYDVGETGIGGQPVQLGGTTIYSSPGGGDWYVVKPAGTYTVTYTPWGMYSGYTCTPASYSVNATTVGNTYSGNDFGLNVPPGISNVCIEIFPLGNVVSGGWVNARYTIRVYTASSSPVQGTLFMHYDTNLIYSSATTPVPTQVNTPAFTLSWSVNILPGQILDYRPRFTLPAGYPLGTPILNSAVFVPDSGFTLTNSACAMDTLHQVTVGFPYDPNTKQVFPEGNGPQHLIANGQPLDYTITFQNTGNAPAVNVILQDTIEADLDLATFEMLEASHTYHLQQEGRNLTWIFSNIMLPDSATNFDESIGYVHYRMNPVPSLPGGTLVNNRAGIYFDWNDVVITNYAFNTIDLELSTADLEKSNLTLVLQPNPFRESVTVKIVNTDNTEMSMKLMDITGRLLNTYTSTNGVFVIERNLLPAGMYLVEVSAGTKPLGTAKLIAE